MYQRTVPARVGQGIKNQVQSQEMARSSRPDTGYRKLIARLHLCCLQFGLLSSHPLVRGVPVGTWSSALRSSEAFPVQRIGCVTLLESLTNLSLPVHCDAPSQPELLHSLLRASVPHGYCLGQQQHGPNHIALAR